MRRRKKSPRTRTRTRTLRTEPLEERRLLAITDWQMLCPSWIEDFEFVPGRGRAVVIEGWELPDLSGYPLAEEGYLDLSHQCHLIDGEIYEAAGVLPLADQPLQTVSQTFTPISEIPLLSSLPGATATLYLDFNGHFEETWGAYSNITTPVYDADGDASTFSEAELAFIHGVWADVAEDYAPFNINVTTIEPPELAPGAPSSAADGVAMRIAIGGDSSWLGSNYGGFAYIGAFTNYIPNVAYVFAGGRTDSMGQATAVAHEAGHAFGLYHHVNNHFDAQARQSAIMWGMGFGYEHTYWHREIVEDGTLQDDMAIIAGPVNGFGYRADDHGNSLGGATPLGADLTASGIIGTMTDRDVFAVPAGSFHFTLEGHSPGQNLDAVLELLDSSGNVLLTADPGDSLDASLIGGGGGTIYIAVRSTGQYGRVGQYTLTATPSSPGVTVNTSGPILTTSELGRSETITLSLNARPMADVTFSFDLSDSTEASLSASQVTFTPDNWFTAQSIVVTGKADGIDDGAAGYTLTLSPASSDDPAYAGMDPADLSLVNLDEAAGRLYWMTYHGSSELATIETSTLAGDNVQTLLDAYTAYGEPDSSYYHPENLAIDSLRGKLYWSDSTNDKIYSANLDGSDPQVVIAGIERPYGLAVDTVAGKLYWIEVSLRQIRRANLDGSQIETIVSEGIGTSGELAIDSAAGKIYWENPSTRTISRANLDGTDAEVIVSGDGTQQHRAFALDPAAGKIYFNRRTPFSSNQLYRANLDGTGEELLLDISALYPTVDGSVESMTVDAASGRFYWTTYGGRLFSADLDGSNLALVSELGVSGRLTGLGIMPASPGVTVTPRSGLVTSEAGDSASFSVVLDSKPSADVTIPVASSDPTEGSVSVSSLVFTPENWNVPQSVAINPVDEVVMDGDVAFAIDFGPVASADPNYNGRSIASLAVTNLDNDAPLFADSFEVGEWNGLWVEDSQNDWFRSTQRSTEGSRSAEVDGSASDASLTMATGVDLTPFATVELSFDWYIESTLDRNEYLAVDIFNGTWREVARLRGNADQENTWHHETIEISGSDLVEDFKIRFRGRMNSSNEDANVDNVKIVGTSLAGPPNELPTALAGGPYATMEGASLTLSAGGSFDPDGTIVGYQWDLDGDGQFDDASGPAPTVSLTGSGVQTIGLQVTDDRGGTATASAIVNVANVGPTATLSGPTSTSEGTTINLSAAGSTDPGNDIVSVTWDLDGDGQFDDASGTTASFTPADNGTFTVGVRVADDDGAFDTASLQVSAGNVAPTASLAGSFSATPGEPVTFSGSATDPGADTLTYEWDFSYNGSFTVDAAGVNLTSPSQTYASDGTTTVALRVRDDDGGISAIRTAEVNVSSAPTDLLYFSMGSNATVGGISAANEDILALEADGGVRMIFDGSDVGLSSRTLAGFSITGANEILLAFTSSTSLPGLGTVDDSDIVKFTATSLGNNTAGSFSMYFDGSDVGLSSSSERLSAFHSLPDGRLIISTTGTAYVPGASAARQDLLLFDPSSLGSSTSGSWSVFFDGSDVGLSSSSENIDAVSIDAQGRLYLSTTGNFSVPGRSGTNEDVFVFTASTLGSSTSGSFTSSLYVDGSALGLGGNDIRGVTLPEQVPTIGAIVSPRPAKRGSFDRPAESSPQVEQAAMTVRSARLLDLAFGWEEESASATSADELSLARKSINHRSSAATSLVDATLAAAFEGL